jgi:hypothetical protein
MASVQLTKKLLAEYRNGGEGMIKWANDNVWIPIYPEGSDSAVWHPIGNLPDTPNPETGRSYRSMWENQQKYLRDALEMENGRFKHRLIIFCWMRGEGKSAIACLVQLWKFMCFPKQQIVLGANSKDQTKFVHYDIIRDTILNSPNLVEWIGRENVQEKQITIRNRKTGAIMSAIRSISSFSGIVSNITGYTFSEMFDMKNPKFFTQLDGSTRNVPNALGVIDSTVSTKSHTLYKLYMASLDKSIPELYFSHRQSPAASASDFFHPQMSQKQLDAYSKKFPTAEFDRYFRNTWEAGAVRFFNDTDVQLTHFIGLDGTSPSDVRPFVDRYVNALKRVEGIEKSITEHEPTQELVDALTQARKDVAEEQQRLAPLSRYMPLSDSLGGGTHATVAELRTLGDIYKTDWSIHVGLDRADPMSQGEYSRTVMWMIAKGLPMSKVNSNILMETSPEYIYVLCGLAVFRQHNLEDIKAVLAEWDSDVDGIDTFCSERWGAWDLQGWCEENGIACELISPTYERQRSAFNEMFVLVRSGRLKVAPTHVSGSRGGDIFEEELSLFVHDADKKWFGSPEKSSNGGIQDDTIYSCAWGIYGGRNVSFTNFRRRGAKIQGIGFYPNQNLHGVY